MPVSFPLMRIVDGECECGDDTCKAVGKHPAVKAWNKLTETVPAAKGQGIGIPTGVINGVFVVETDNRDGKEGEKELLRLFGEMPRTLTARSPTGSIHRYFKQPEFPVKTTAGEIAPGVDVRGEDGFVVAPSSPHRNGGVYEIVDETNPVDAPAALLACPALRRYAQPARATSQPVYPNTKEEDAWYDAECIRYLRFDAPLSISGEGGQDIMFVVAMFVTRKFLRKDDRAIELIEEYYNPRLKAHGTETWRGKDLRHKVRDGREQGTLECGIKRDGEEIWSAIQGAKVSVFDAIGANIKSVTAQESAKKFQLNQNVSSGKRAKMNTHEIITHLITDRDWMGVLRYDAFSRKYVAINPPVALDLEKGDFSEGDEIRIANWFWCVAQKHTMPTNVREAVIAICEQNTHHPLLEYIEGLDARDTKILDNLATKVFEAKRPMENVFLKKFLVAAVRRAIHPGTQVDTILILQGGQGDGKSTFVKTLFSQPWTRTQMPSLADRDASMALMGRWGVELGELDQLLRGANSTAKDFVSRTHDQYRKFGKGTQVEQPRQCVFIGTTNEEDFLRDPTGDRRYWPIKTFSVDLEFVRTHRDEIWGNALHFAQDSTFIHYLSPEEKSSAEKYIWPCYRSVEPWTDAINEYCKGRDFVRTEDVYQSAICRGGLDARAKLDRGISARIISVLTRAGWKRSSKRVEGKVVSGYAPKALADVFDESQYETQ